MKRLFLLIAVFAAFTASSQTLTYRIDRISEGGYYLVEIQTPDATATDKTVKEFPQKFADAAQLKNYVAYLKNQAADARKQATRVEDSAAKIEALVPTIELPVVTNPVVAPPVKPKKVKVKKQ